MNSMSRLAAIVFICRLALVANPLFAQSPPELRAVRLTNQVELSWNDAAAGSHALEVTDRLGPDSTLSSILLAGLRARTTA